MTKPRLGFIGVGSMASAIINGIVNHTANDFIISLYNRSFNSNLEKLQFSCQIVSEVRELILFSDVIFLGVKPVDMTGLIKHLKQLIDQDNIDIEKKLFVSMAAGYELSNLENLLSTRNVARIMPNTPIRVNQGVTGIYAHPLANYQLIKILFSSLQAISLLYRCDNESQINAVIAVSGSGPAYFFKIFAAMQDTAVKELGINQEDARKLILKTALGAIGLSEELQVDFNELAAQVTSKKGTTQAALETFTELKLADILSLGMLAAYQRAQEMEMQFNLDNKINK